jgi:hypothetical protein
VNGTGNIGCFGALKEAGGSIFSRTGVRKRPLRTGNRFDAQS